MSRAPVPSSTIERLLGAIASGDGIPVDLYAPSAVLDATVPDWRFRRVGADAIAATYAGWFAAPGRFEELQRCPLADGGGEVVTYLLAWEEDGSPMAAHHTHHLVLDREGSIVHDTVFCGGRWPAALLAQMSEAGL